MNQFKREQGVAIVLGILIVLLLGILGAISFDLALIFSARNQARQTSQLGALAAIKSHYALERADGQTDKEYLNSQMEAALAGAQRVLSNNAIFGSTKSYFQELVLGYTEGGKAPMLIAGSYKYTENPEDPEASGGCGDPEKEEYPRCFKEYDENTNPVVTAYLIQGPVATDAGGVFSGFVPSLLKIKVATVATFQPINFAGIMDTSRSVAYITHRLADDLAHPCYKSEFAYSDGVTNPDYIAHLARGERNMGDGTGVLDLLPADPCRHYAAADLNDGDYQGVTPRADGAYAAEDEEVRPNPGDFPAARYSTSDLPGVFMVDMMRDFDMPGPEPFQSILGAYKTTLTKFAETAKFGDKASLIGISDNLYWPSIILPQTSDHLDEISDMLKIDAITDGGIKNSLFPMDLTFTNLQLGLKEAVEQLKTTGGVNLRGHFVIFTDGVSNCVTLDSGQCIGFYDWNSFINRQFCCNPGNGNCHSDGMPDEEFYRCENSYSVYDQSMTRLITYVQDNIVEPGIGTVSVIHVGPGANRRNKTGSGANNCLSESESISGGIMPVYWEPTVYDAVSAFEDFTEEGAPFYEPSQYLFRLASMSGGVYIPVLSYDPACNETCDNDPNRPAITCSQTSIETQVRDGLEKILAKRSFQVSVSE